MCDAIGIHDVHAVSGKRIGYRALAAADAASQANNVRNIGFMRVLTHAASLTGSARAEDIQKHGMEIQCYQASTRKEGAKGHWHFTSTFCEQN